MIIKNFLFIMILTLISIQTSPVQSSVAEVSKKIISHYQLDKLKNIENSEVLKKAIMAKIRGPDKKISIDAPLAVRNESLNFRGEAYFWLGQLEAESFYEQKAAISNPAKKDLQHLKDLNAKVKDTWNEATNLLGNAVANLTRIDDMDAGPSSKIAEAQILMKKLDEELEKFSVLMTDKINQQIKNQAPKRPCGLFHFLFPFKKILKN